MRTIQIAAAILALGCQGLVTAPEVVEPDGPGTIPPLDSCADVTSVGPAPLARITNARYAGAVADLLDPIEVGDPTAGLVADSALGGFHSNAAVPLGDLELRAYADEAARLGDLVIAEPEPWIACPTEPTAELGCARAFIAVFMTRAFRRPVDDAEIDGALGLFSATRDALPFIEAIATVVETVLQSPHFLYQVELAPDDVEDGDIIALGDHELATRLAFFLWNTAPDETLRDAAEAGELRDAAGIERHARRMLANPRARAMVHSFHAQWLGVDDLRDTDKDAEAFPTFDRTLGTLMRREIELFAADVVLDGDGRLETLLLSRDAFARLGLYEHYGIAGASETWERVELPEGQRAGLLTRAGFMAAHAHPDQTSPVHRGRTIRENFFCETLPAPPPDVDDTPPDPDPNLSARERFAAHSEVASCAACHQLMDPIGLAFENYDGIGRYRMSEGAGAPIDASGEIHGTDVAGTFDGPLELSRRILESEQARQCVVRNWFRYALGRGETDADGLHDRDGVRSVRRVRLQRARAHRRDGAERRVPTGRGAHSRGCGLHGGAMKKRRRSSRLSRRDLLLGLGGAGALSTLRPFVPLTRAADEYPKRLIIFTTMMGMGGEYPAPWEPAGTGRGYSFAAGSVLEPLAPFRDRLLVINGITNQAGIDSNLPGAHPVGLGTMLTGGRVGAADREWSAGAIVTGPR